MHIIRSGLEQENSTKSHQGARRFIFDVLQNLFPLLVKTHDIMLWGSIYLIIVLYPPYAFYMAKTLFVFLIEDLCYNGIFDRSLFALFSFKKKT